jgi:hypothetical protein
VDKIEILTKNFENYIKIPWTDAAALQRVIFSVYDKTIERRVRLRKEEFKIATIKAGHTWEEFDLTDIFASWLTSQRYTKEYFSNPEYLNTLLPKFLEYIIKEFETFLSEHSVDGNTVVAVIGAGTLFGFLKVREAVEKMAPLVEGRLLIFFPGSFENNNYRLLDAYDGWNYHAVPITSDDKADYI